MASPTVATWEKPSSPQSLASMGSDCSRDFSAEGRGSSAENKANYFANKRFWLIGRAVHDLPLRVTIRIFLFRIF